MRPRGQALNTLAWLQWSGAKSTPANKLPEKRKEQRVERKQVEKSAETRARERERQRTLAEEERGKDGG